MLTANWNPSKPAGLRVMQHYEGAFEPEKGKNQGKEIEVIIFLKVLGRVPDREVILCCKKQNWKGNIKQAISME